MLYTRKGDDGTTKTFGCDQRISKSSNIAEALGCMDEVNSYLGVCKNKAKAESLLKHLQNKCSYDQPRAGLVKLAEKSAEEIVHEAQKNLFIIQAELAGADKTIDEGKVREIEAIIDAVEKELPPIKTFFIPGASELGAHFDFGRTLARRAERRVVAVKEEGKVALSDETMAYLNRLSSLLYALARLSSHKSGINEEAPDYE